MYFPHKAISLCEIRTLERHFSPATGCHFKQQNHQPRAHTHTKTWHDRPWEGHALTEPVLKPEGKFIALLSLSQECVHWATQTFVTLRNAHVTVEAPGARIWV